MKVRALGPLSMAVALCLGAEGTVHAALPLGLNEVLKSTRRHHPEIARAMGAVRVAEGRVLSGSGTFDPRLQAKGEFTPYGDFEAGKSALRIEQRTGLWGLRLSGGWEIGRGDIPIYKKESATSAGGKASIGIDLPLLRGGAIDKGRAALWSARHRRVAARLMLDAVTLELSRRAAHRYWAWVAAGRRLHIAKDLLSIAEARAGQIATRIESGALPPIAAIENERAILKRRGALVKAQRSFEKAALKLSLYLRSADGRPRLPDPKRLPSSLPSGHSIPNDAGLAADLRHALANRPELKALSVGRKAIDVTRQLAENRRLPKIDLLATGSYDLGREPYESRRVEVMLGFSFSFPVFMREARGKLQQAVGKLGIVDAKRRIVANKIVAQVRDTHSAIRAAARALKIARREVKVAHRVEEAERERLRLGASTLLTVNIREQASAEAEIRAIDAAETLLRALADRRALTAVGLRVKSGS